MPNKAQLLSWFRGLLKLGAGALAAHGVTQETATAQLTQAATAAITFLVAQIWSHAVHADNGTQATTPSPGIGGTLKLLMILAIPALVIFTPACKQTLAPGGAYSTIDTNTGQALGPFVFAMDKTLVDSKDTLTAFLTWELQNRGSLTGGLHSVTVAADQIRLQAPAYFTNAYNLRSNYLWIVANAPAQVAAASNSFSVTVSTIQALSSSSGALTNAFHL